MADVSAPAVPDVLLPFAVREPDLATLVRRWLGGLSLAPGDLATAARLEEHTARYVPFWLFDAGAHAVYAGRRGEQVTQTVPYHPDAQGRRTDGKGNLIDTWGRRVNEFGQQIDDKGRPVPNPDNGPPVHWHPVSGKVHHAFRNQPVPGTSRLPGRHVEQLTWDFAALAPWPPGGVEGVHVEAADRDRDTAAGLARKAMDQHLQGLCRQQIGGTRQELSSFQSMYEDLNCRLALVPVWLVRYSYGGKTYDLAVDGHGGHVVGDRPYSKAKLGLLIGGIIAGVVLFFAVILALFFGLMRH